jgi:hypothetical protein
LDSSNYPKPHLLHLTLNLAIDCDFWVEKELTTGGACPAVGDVVRTNKTTPNRSTVFRCDLVASRTNNIT